MGNIDTMAKHLTLDEESDPRDGKFEVIRWPHATKPQLLLSLLRAALSKPPEHSHVDRLAFRTLKPMPMQLDGEIVELEADTGVEVTVRREALRTFI